MATKFNRINFDWWIISKRTIYAIILALALGALAGGMGIYTWLYGNPFKNAAIETGAPIGARFVSFDGDVRVMRAATRQTIQVRGDTQLYPGDIVQTQEDGRARIMLVDGSTLVVRPNSVVTIRDNTSSEGGQKTNVRVAIDRGQINVRTEQQTAGTTNIVMTRQTENRLGAQTGASFGVREDNTEDIRVTTGSIETATRSGEKIVVRGGEYMAVNQTGSVARREKLLDVPAPIAPRDLEKIFAAGLAASVVLRWQRPASGAPAHYHVEVASSPFFVPAGKVVERDKLAATEFNASDLRPGVYYWHVRAVAVSGQVSEWSEPQKFIVAPEGTGEPVAVSDLFVEYIAGNIYLVRGRTQPGNTLRIQGRASTAASDGSFQLQVSAPEGTREVTLEAEDLQGNKTEHKLELTKGAARSKR